jgi:photosystem II stability/assembly factor-like uncharacterized protein
MGRRVAALVVCVALFAGLLAPAPAGAALTWTTQTAETNAALWSVDMLNATEGWVVGAGGTILHTTDGGAHWVPQASGTTQDLHYVDMVSSTAGWAVGGGGTILRYSSGIWTPQTSGTTAALWCVSMLGTGDGWVVGDYGTILRYSHGAWAASAQVTNRHLWCVSMITDADGMAAGQYGTVLRWDGTSWQAAVSADMNAWGFDRADAGRAWAVGPAGLIRAFDGVSWTAQTSGTSSDLDDVSMLNASEGWAVGAAGTIVHYTGGTWWTQTSGTTQALHGVQMLSAASGWAVGENGTILRYKEVPATGSVVVSAEAPAAQQAPSLTFAVAGQAAPGGGSVAGSALDFGLLAHGVPKTGIQRISVTTSAASGYAVTVSESGPLASGPNTIPDFPGDGGGATEIVAGAWSYPTTYGFGYGLANVTGTDAVFADGLFKQFANVGSGETPQEIMRATGPVSGSQVDVTYKVNIGATQAQGTYTNTITYTATGNF